MSTIVATGHQIGLHSNTLNNFTWYQPGTPDGSVILGQGNYGNTVVLLTVSNTTVTFSPNATFSARATFNANVTFNANATFSANVVLSGGLVANSSVGSNGQVLTSNGSTSYWATSSAATTGKAIAMAIVFGG